jgi:hypothetical protein
VKVFDGTSGAVAVQFMAYDAAFRGGIVVGAGFYDADARADIVTGPGAGGGPHVRVFSGAAPDQMLANFFAFIPDSPGSSPPGGAPMTSGVGSVALTDADGDGVPDIAVATGRGLRTGVRAFKRAGGQTPARAAFPAALGILIVTPLFFVDGAGDMVAPQLRDGANVAGFTTFSAV